MYKLYTGVVYWHLQMDSMFVDRYHVLIEQFLIVLAELDESQEMRTSDYKLTNGMFFEINVS